MKEKYPHCIWNIDEREFEPDVVEVTIKINPHDSELKPLKHKVRYGIALVI